MKIKLNSVFVDDQDQALKFYTEVWGFVKKTDMSVGIRGLDNGANLIETMLSIQISGTLGISISHREEVTR